MTNQQFKQGKKVQNGTSGGKYKQHTKVQPKNESFKKRLHNFVNRGFYVSLFLVVLGLIGGIGAIESLVTTMINSDILKELPEKVNSSVVASASTIIVIAHTVLTISTCILLVTGVYQLLRLVNVSINVSKDVAEGFNHYSKEVKSFCSELKNLVLPIKHNQNEQEIKESLSDYFVESTNQSVPNNVIPLKTSTSVEVGVNDSYFESPFTTSNPTKEAMNNIDRLTKEL